MTNIKTKINTYNREILRNAPSKMRNPVTANKETTA